MPMPKPGNLQKNHNCETSAADRKVQESSWQSQ